MRAALALAMTTACASCGPAPVRSETIDDQRQRELDRIADQCGEPRDTLKLLGDLEVQVKPASDASFEGLNCVLKGFQESKTPFKLGFVGNQAVLGNDL